MTVPGERENEEVKGDSQYGKMGATPQVAASSIRRGGDQTM
jgi:hypothetical protein